jgi:hypothetical protein
MIILIHVSGFYRHTVLHDITNVWGIYILKTGAIGCLGLYNMKGYQQFWKEKKATLLDTMINKGSGLYKRWECVYHYLYMWTELSSPVSRPHQLATLRSTYDKNTKLIIKVLLSQRHKHILIISIYGFNSFCVCENWTMSGRHIKGQRHTTAQAMQLRNHFLWHDMTKLLVAFTILRTCLKTYRRKWNRKGGGGTKGKRCFPFWILWRVFVHTGLVF